MKKVPFFILLMLSGMLYAQLSPNVISFENGNHGGIQHTPAEGTVVDNAYFSQAYGVTFHMNSPGGNTLPYIAQVGQQSTNNGFGFVGPAGNIYSSSQGNGCTVPATVTADKPDTLLDVGCFFLTDDPNGPGRNPQSLYALYDGVSCSVASGYLLDIDGHLPTGNHPSWQEGWKITAFPVNPSASPQSVYMYSPYYANYDPNPVGPSNGSPTGDGIASYWEVDLGTETIKYIEFDYIGSPNAYVGIAFDEFNLCSAAQADSTGCCDGTNLIPNGTFEAGNTGFSSGYTNQSTFSANSIIPGQYGIVNSAQALAVSPQWSALNHTNCSTSGTFMAVNGRTMTNSSVAVYQQLNIPVEEDKEYVLCYYYKSLPQCAFEVWQDGNLTPVISGGSSTLNTCGKDTTGLCGWTKASYTVIPNGNTISFSLYLNQGGVGDGNDFALDDISLQEKQVMPGIYSSFTPVPSTPTNGYRNYTATADFSPLPAGFDVTWRAVEIDCGFPANEFPGTAQTWTNSPYVTNFPGYCCNTGGTNAGVFYEARCYKVTRTVTNCCYEDVTYTAIFGNGVSLRMMPGTTEEEAVYGHLESTDGVNWVQVLEGEPTEKTDGASSGKGLKLYPNPGNGNLNLRGSNSLKGLNITVSDIKGKVLFSNEIEEERSEVEMDLTELPSGMYLIQLQSEDGSVRQEKYVKQ